MKKDVLINKIMMDCPMCGEYHEIEERKRETSITIKGERVFCEEIYYLCNACDEEENEFVPSKINDKNLLVARDAYRVKMGLLTSKEIAGIRKSYGLSQSDFAKLLGWGEITITRYESKTIQDEAYDNMLRIVRDNPMETYKFLEKNKEKFSNEKYQSIKSKIIDNIEKYGQGYLKRQVLASAYVEYLEPSEMNGFQQLDIDKIEAIVTYFARQIPKLYKVKLMKLLWYADALCYQCCGKSLTGLVYRHQGMGALPIGHYKLMELENILVEEEECDEFDNVKIHVLPNSKIDIGIIPEEERDILDRVIDKFGSFSGIKLAGYMHEEEAYLKTKDKEIISFELAKKIRRI